MLQFCHGNCYLFDRVAIRACYHSLQGPGISLIHLWIMNNFLQWIYNTVRTCWTAGSQGKNCPVVDSFLLAVSPGLLLGLFWCPPNCPFLFMSLWMEFYINSSNWTCLHHRNSYEQGFVHIKLYTCHCRSCRGSLYWSVCAGKRSKTLFYLNISILPLNKTGQLKKDSVTGFHLHNLWWHGKSNVL